MGNLLGNVIPFDTGGIEFSMTALFVASFVSQWKTTKNHTPALIGLFCSLVCLIILGAEHFLIPAMLLITFVLLLLRKSTDERKEPEK